MIEIVKVTWIDAQRLETTLCDEEEMKSIEPIECDIVGFAKRKVWKLAISGNIPKINAMEK